MADWRKSSRSCDTGNCVQWRKSSRSFSSGACVEARHATDRWVDVRDSKDPGGPILSFDGESWSAFLNWVCRSDG